jgi:hypothetical protein
MNEWHDFLVATAGASAALTGLIFVGVSINLNRILSLPTLPARASISMILLLAILIVTILLLVPYQSTSVPGAEVLIIGTIVWLRVLITDIRILRNKEKQYQRAYAFNLVLDQIAVLPYLISGITLMCGNLNGLYWLLTAIVFSFIKASLDAWVLLIEINR